MSRLDVTKDGAKGGGAAAKEVTRPADAGLLAAVVAGGTGLAAGGAGVPDSRAEAGGGDLDTGDTGSTMTVSIPAEALRLQSELNARFVSYKISSTEPLKREIEKLANTLMRYMPGLANLYLSQLKSLDRDPEGSLRHCQIAAEQMTDPCNKLAIISLSHHYRDGVGTPGGKKDVMAYVRLQIVAFLLPQRSSEGAIRVIDLSKLNTETTVLLSPLRLCLCDTLRTALASKKFKSIRQDFKKLDRLVGLWMSMVEVFMYFHEREARARRGDRDLSKRQANFVRILSELLKESFVTDLSVAFRLGSAPKVNYKRIFDPLFESAKRRFVSLFASRHYVTALERMKIAAESLAPDYDHLLHDAAHAFTLSLGGLNPDRVTNYTANSLLNAEPESEAADDSKSAAPSTLSQHTMMTGFTRMTRKPPALPSVSEVAPHKRGL